MDKAIALPGKQYVIADFSPHGSKLLIERQGGLGPRSIDYRDVSVAVIDLHNDRLEWHNVWDFLGWKNCSATVETQGFDKSGNIVIKVRPSTWQTKQRPPDCVSQPMLKSISDDFKEVNTLPSEYSSETFGHVARPRFQACKSDPDIVAACFLTHGRLSIYNGCCNTRIWEIGTHHMLYDYDDILPESLASKIDLDSDVYGDYLVCPMEKQRPGHMQAICIENAKNLRVERH